LRKVQTAFLMQLIEFYLGVSSDRPNPKEEVMVELLLVIILVIVLLRYV